MRRRPHRLPRGNKERRTRGSVWLQSPLIGMTAEDSRQQATSREEEDISISNNSITSSIDSNSSSGSSRSSSSNEDSDSTMYHSSSTGEDSMDYKSDKEDRVWSREEILQHQQQQQCQQLLLLKRREGLLDITVRTVNLMRRNQQLQHRLAALQAETRAFVRSVLSNPENQAIRELTSRSWRKLKSESHEEEEICAKKAKSQDEEDVSTTETTMSSPTDITPAVTKMEQESSFSEGDNK